MEKSNLTSATRIRNVPGISRSKIPFTYMNTERSRTRKNKLAQPRKTKRNSLKKKGPIFLLGKSNLKHFFRIMK